MKCVGAEDGQKQCQRCKRANVEYVHIVSCHHFPSNLKYAALGVSLRNTAAVVSRVQSTSSDLAQPSLVSSSARLSEASKMLRRLEKGLNNAKLKSQNTETTLGSPYQGSDSRNPQDLQYSGMRSAETSFGSPTTHFPSNELPPLNPNYHNAGYPPSSNGSRSMDLDDDEGDPDRNSEVFPEKLIRRENQRNSFFRTILNPEETPSTNGGPPSRGNSSPPVITVPGLHDPITAGLIDEDQAKVLFDLIFLRLNPFINLFDPALHTVPYVRSKCPFLFTTLIMAGCKFFRPELFKQCQKLASELAVRAFADAWKRVEVVQAFACLTYWQDPNDNVRQSYVCFIPTLIMHQQRTWTYIGYVSL